MTRAIVSLGICLVLFQVMPHTASAQSKTAWGLNVSYTPKFYMWSNITHDVKHHTMSGREIAIGFVHGRTDGGDWGFSLLYKRFREGGRFTKTFGGAQQPTTEEYTLHGVSVTGVEFHWYKPVITIKRRVQIGVNLGLGPGQAAGTIDIERDYFEVVQFTPFVVEHKHTFVSQPITLDDFPTPFPLAKAELAGGVILSPRLKIKASGGLNFPSVRSFRIEGVYFFN